MPQKGPALRKAALLGAAFLFLAGACAGLPDAFGGSRQAVSAWAAARNFSTNLQPAGNFRIFVAERVDTARRTGSLTIYIEGDGAAWPSIYHPPADPTPDKPTAMALAAADSADAVVYLGRPCQYLDAADLAGCDPAYWTNRRFAPEVVAAYDGLVSGLKARHAADSIRLVGYSGGGVIAALVAARRQDVASLVTVAAPLALGAWTGHHRISSLTASLDPMAATGRLPQGVHWVGGHDRNVPSAIVAEFVRVKGGHLRTVADFDHECCWSREWPRLLTRMLGEETVP